MKLHPKVVVEIQESVSDQLLRTILLDRLDVALVSAAAPEANSLFLTEPLFSEPVWLFGPADRRDVLRRQKLDELPLILTHSNNPARDLAERAMMKSGRRLNVVAETDSPRLMVEMMKAGLGYTIAPYLTFSDHIARRELAGAPIGRLAVQRFVISRKDRSANRAIQLFKTLLQPEIQQARKNIAATRLRHAGPPH